MFVFYEVFYNDIQLVYMDDTIIQSHSNLSRYVLQTSYFASIQIYK